VAAPERYPDYCAFSREGFPAITALVSLMRPELERLRHSNRGEFDAAKQFVAGSSDQLCEPAATSALAARGYRADCLLSGRSGPRTQPADEETPCSAHERNAMASYDDDYRAAVQPTSIGGLAARACSDGRSPAARRLRSTRF